MNYRPAILLAAHDKSFVFSLATLLGRIGFDVIPVEKDEKTLSLTKKFMPDIILLDEDLPVTGGFDTLQRLKEDSYTFFIPVIMMAGSSNMQMVENCKKMECTAHINKPIHLMDFNRTIYKCLNSNGGKKRRHLRAMYEKDVAVQHDTVTTEYHAVTLSEGGIFLRDMEPLPPGEKVTITIQPDGHTSMEIKGSVIYTKNIYGGVFNIGPGMGIAFEEMTNDSSAYIKQYLVNKLTAGPHVKRYIVNEDVDNGYH